MSSYSDHLVRIAGGDLATVATLRRARLMHHLLAYAMLITSVMATVSMTFFAHDAMHAPIPVAMVVGLCWGVLIFMLERVVTTLGMGTAGVGAALNTLLRVGMALVIGAIISAPLTMRIFKSDIDFAMAQMAARNAGTIKKEIEESPEQAQVDQLQSEVTRWRQVEQGVLPDQQDSSAVVAATQQLTAAQGALDEAQHDLDQNSAWYNCEKYGADREKLDDPSICAPGVGGDNGNTAAAEKARDASQRKVAAAQATVATKTAALQRAQRAQEGAVADQVRDLSAQAPDELDALARQLTAAEAQLQTLKDRLNGTNHGNTGFLAQLKGLDEASAHDATLNFWKWLIFWAFVLLDVLPVTSKLSWLFSPDGRRYHECTAMADASALSSHQAQLAADEEVERDRIEADRDMRIRLNQEAVLQAEQVLRARLQEELDAWKTSMQTGTSVPVSFGVPAAISAVQP